MHAQTITLQTRAGLPAHVSTRLVEAAGFHIQGYIEHPPGRVQPHLWRRGGWWLEPDAMGLDEPHPNDLVGVPQHGFHPAEALA